MRNAFLSLAAIGLLLAQGCGNKGVMTNAVVPAIQTNGQANGQAARYTNRLVVKFKTGTTDSQVRSFQQRFSLRSLNRVSALGLGVMGLPEGKTAQSALASIQGHPAIDYVEPDFILKTTPVRKGFAPRKPIAKAAAKPTARKSVLGIGFLNDADGSREWGMEKIGMPKVWSINAGAPTVTVAVIDTGVDTRHPDLSGNLVAGFSVFANSSGPDDDHGHGTHVAGVVAGIANNQVGIAGVAPRCKIMPVKVLNREGKGATSDIVTGIIWAVDNGAKVINMSLGGPGGSRALMDAINYAKSKDVVLVAAMGNEGKNSQEYPAGYAGVIAVGATTESDELASFSNTGSWISVSAPGEDIYSTLPTRPVHVTENEGKDTDYDSMDGTSMASPFVAGLAALIKSQYPTMSATAIRNRIERSADDLGAPGFDEEFGHGRINAYQAVFGK